MKKFMLAKAPLSKIVGAKGESCRPAEGTICTVETKGRRGPRLGQI